MELSGGDNDESKIGRRGRPWKTGSVWQIE